MKKHLQRHHKVRLLKTKVVLLTRQVVLPSIKVVLLWWERELLCIKFSFIIPESSTTLMRRLSFFSESCVNWLECSTTLFLSMTGMTAESSWCDRSMTTLTGSSTCLMGSSTCLMGSSTTWILSSTTLVHYWDEFSKSSTTFNRSSTTSNGSSTVSERVFHKTDKKKTWWTGNCFPENDCFQWFEDILFSGRIKEVVLNLRKLSRFPSFDSR